MHGAECGIDRRAANFIKQHFAAIRPAYQPAQPDFVVFKYRITTYRHLIIAGAAGMQFLAGFAN